MRSVAYERLLQVNRAFYQNLGDSFADTRARPQPGVVRATRSLPSDARVLDAGCGHGLAADALAEAGFRGRYLGVDASRPLLERARRRVSAPWAEFRRADLADPTWKDRAGIADDRFEAILAFAVFHHLPGDALRLRVAEDLRTSLGPSGTVAVSVWDFPRSERLAARAVDWAEVGLSAEDVDPGDALLDWRSAGYGLRYVHHFTPDDLERLARRAGFVLSEAFRSDGEGGQLGIYQIWTVAAGSEPAPW